QFDTLRLRLIKTAARIVEMKTRIKIHLPTSAPDQSVVRLVLGRLPRLVT
ncbi:MAG TPA: transposase, partial [Rhodospirillales bacterium]|nr:transposase [Rhodospirillales bacterium]